ncbi:chemotaxis protein CheW [Bacillus sp. N9]
MLTEKVVVFHAGKEEYAIPIPYVISIEKIEAMNPIPHLPAYVVGMTKARER